MPRCKQEGHCLTQKLHITEITLYREGGGLGFTIVGGTDHRQFEEDTGIFVKEVNTTGAAVRDKRLWPGDKIIEVNGTNIEAMRHEEAREVFVKAGETVTMRLQHGAEKHVKNLLYAREKACDATIVAMSIVLAVILLEGLFNS